MTLPGAHMLGELWYKDLGSTRSTSYTAASTFVATATKLCFFDADFSNLTQESVPNRCTQEAAEGKPAPINTRRMGSFSFRMWLEGGSSTTSPDTVTTLLGIGMGGLRSPTAISDLAEAASTATTIKATSHGMEENELVLVGAIGDSGGDGRVAPIADASNANEYTLQLALPGAPAENAVLKNGHTVYMDYADESYQDFLFVGAHAGTGATDDPDSYQMLGCSLSGVAITGFENGAAEVEFTYQCAEWQFVSQANQATFDPTTAASGGVPVSGFNAGSMQIQDAGTTTRNAISTGVVTIEIPMNLKAIQDQNYTNNIGGWVKLPNEPGNGPKMMFDAYWANLADMPGIRNDFLNGTAKQVLFQAGNTSESCFAAYIQRGFVQPIAPNSRVDLEENTALKIEVIGDTGRATDLSTDAKKLQDAALVLWFG